MATKSGLGKITELRFRLEAIDQGLCPSEPDYPMPYDILVTVGGNVYKVQVKTAKRTWEKSWYAPLQDNGQPYRLEDVDLFAIYIPELKIWYIIPHLKVFGYTGVTLHPLGFPKMGRKDVRRFLEEYRDAWRLFK